MITRWTTRGIVAGAVAAIAMTLAADVALAAKKRAAARIPQGACKVSSGYIPSGASCTSAPNQFNVSQINLCTFGTLSPGIYCAGSLCPAIKC